MRSKSKILAYLLAAAMVVTSAPANVTFASAKETTPTEKAAKKDVFSWNKAFYDEQSKDDRNKNYSYTVNGSELTTVENFYGSQIDTYTTVDVNDAIYKTDEEGDYVYDEDGNKIVLQRNVNTELSELSPEIPSGSAISRLSFDYQWYQVGQDGKETELEGQQSNYLYPAPEDQYLKNSDGDRTYICKLTLNEITYKYLDKNGNNRRGYFSPDGFDAEDERIDTLNFDMTYRYTYHYAGPTAADFKNGTVAIDDVVAGLDNKDSVAHYSDYVKATTAASGDAIWGNGRSNDGLDAGIYAQDPDEVELPENVSTDNVRFKYTWKAFNAEGKSVTLKDGTRDFTSYIGTLRKLTTKEVFDGKVDDVAYYQIDATYYYGYIELGQYTRRYNVKYTPYEVQVKNENGNIETARDEEPVVLPVRDNGKVTMKVYNVNVFDTEVVYSYTYQWYKVSADGKETKLDNETTDVLKAKITDLTDTYHCRVTAKVRSAYKDKVSYAIDAVFGFASKDGYLVKEISNTNNNVQLNEETDLFIKALADSNYKLSYKWEKLSVEAATQKNENTGAEEEGYKVKVETVGTDNAIKVKAETEDDFVGAPRYCKADDFFTLDDYNVFTLGAYANYRLIVTTEKAGEEPTEYTYYFKLNEDLPDLSIDSNDGTIVAARGQDTTLYAYSKEMSGYTLEKKWYKYVTTKNWTRKTYVNPRLAEADAAPTATPDASATAAPEDVLTCEDPAYQDTSAYHLVTTDEDSSWGHMHFEKGPDGKNRPYWIKSYEAAYYTEVSSKDNGAECVLAGMKGSAYNDDVLGEYIMEANLFQGDAKTALSSQTLHYEVTYDSDLKVYAKNDVVKAAAGAGAVLQVVASNNDTKAYPITYQWAKKNEEGEFVDIDGADGSVLKLEDITTDDYGIYAVTVTDPVYGGELNLQGDKTILLELQPKAVKFIAYTPKDSYYTAYIGDKLVLRADTELEEGVKPFYAWYRSEKVADNTTGETGDDTDNWELINADDSTYELTIGSEDDYTAYRCEMTFLTMKGNEKVSVTQVFNFYVEDAYYFQLQRLTPAMQYKKVGSSATYSAKVLTDNPVIKDTDVTYQWYYYDEDHNRVDIAGATKDTYTISKLTVEDFRTLYVEASVDNKQEKYTVNTSFQTRLQNEATLDEESNEQILKAKVGQSIDLMKPVIKDGDGFKWTYQWYFSSTEDEDIIYGADSASYTIKNIGENEFGTYYCLIYCDGAPWDVFTCSVEEDTDTSHIHAEVADGYKQNAEAVIGRSTSFAVSAVSSDKLALKYQWYKGDEAIGGATASTYKIDKVTPASFGTYSCEVMDENGRHAFVGFSLSRTYELKAETDAYYLENTIGYEVTLGGNQTLTANASCAPEYTLYYQWYKLNTEKDVWEPIENATAKTLDVANISNEDLGSYKCEAYVIDDGAQIYSELVFYYQLYVDTGLVVVPDYEYVLAQADGSVKMHVQAKANADQMIAYEWSKLTEVEDTDIDDDYWNDVAKATPRPTQNGSDAAAFYTAPPATAEPFSEQSAVQNPEGQNVAAYSDSGVTYEYKTIAGAAGDTFTLPAIKNDDYGIYRCVVYTSGETYTYYFYLNAYYMVTTDRGDADNVYVSSVYDQNGKSYSRNNVGINDSNAVYAEEGDTVTVKAQILNAATDMDYTYEWYAQQPVTGTLRKVQADAHAASITQTVPKMGWSDRSLGDTDTTAKEYATQNMKFGVKISATAKDSTAAASEEDDNVVYDSVAKNAYGYVKVISPVTYDNSKFPETTHPFNQVYNVSGFTLPNDGTYRITFSKDTDVSVRVVDDKGTPHYPDYEEGKFVTKDSSEIVEVSGSKAIFITDGNASPAKYGYKVTAIQKIAGKDGKPVSGSTEVATGVASAGAIKKGVKVTAKKLIYKVTKVSKKNGTVALVGVNAKAKKTMKKISVPATLKISGLTYKVTAVNAKAVNKLPKLTSVTIGNNVMTIGASAFANNAKLTSVTVGKKVKTIGAQAFGGDKKLKKITLNTTALTTIGKNAFKGVYAKATVSVPKKQKKAYKKLIRKAGLKKAKIK